MPSEGRRSSELGPAHAALTARFRALGESEPRQVREEAALRIPSQVPRARLARAGDAGSFRGARLDGGCATGPATLGCAESGWESARRSASPLTGPIPGTLIHSSYPAATMPATLPKRSSRARARPTDIPGTAASIASLTSSDTGLRR